MRARDLAYETVSALDANRGRSLLTVLGIVIGISAVIAMTALIGGIKQSIISELGLNQARLVYVWVWGGRATTLDDLAAMESELSDDYELISGQAYGSAEVTSDTEKADGQIHGVTANYKDAMGLKLASGRFFSQEEVNAGAQVVVLDQAGVRTLFGSADADVVGSSVTMKGAQYAIVGVLESAEMGRDQSWAMVYMPFITCANRITGWNEVDQVYGLAREGLDMEAVAQDTRDWLASHFGIADEDREDNMWVSTMQSQIEELDSTMLAFQVLMTSVASISLLVGGIGIMNMMLTNVTERIREIGLRKALGARARDITRQFLLESVCITLVGGVIGMALGYLGAYAFTGLASGLLFGEGTTVTPYLDLRSMLLVTGICVAIGIVFGYYPARRAAKLDPVESLHYQ